MEHVLEVVEGTQEVVVVAQGLDVVVDVEDSVALIEQTPIDLAAVVVAVEALGDPDAKGNNDHGALC